jgi:hypothetical protein
MSKFQLRNYIFLYGIAHIERNGTFEDRYTCIFFFKDLNLLKNLQTLKHNLSHHPKEFAILMI